MKLMLLLLAATLALPCSAYPQTVFDWHSQIICSDCMPGIAWFSDEKTGTLYTGQVDPLSPMGYQTVYRTLDAGGTWIKLVDSAALYTNTQILSVISQIDAASLFWSKSKEIIPSEDTGRTWGKSRFMFPVQKQIRMFTSDSGLGVMEEEVDGKNNISLRETTDGGYYWYDQVGNAYVTSREVNDAIIVSDSIAIVMLHDSKGSELIATYDRGATWHSMFVTSAQEGHMQLSLLQGSNIVVLESWADTSIRLSLDSGVSWVSPLVDGDNFYYRTRASKWHDRPLILWAAAGNAKGGATERLLHDNDHSFATKLMFSFDTGRTWSREVIPGLPEGAQLFDLIPMGDKITVVSFFDSTTYVSTAATGSLGVDNFGGISSPALTLFPNPLVRGGSITIDASFAATSYVIVDALGIRRASGVVHEGRLDAQSSSLTPGAYAVMLYDKTMQIGQGKLIVQ